jgi:catechol 2,3-dioxygenase-like lactoylglutathione lyase family enzyme
VNGRRLRLSIVVVSLLLLAGLVLGVTISAAATATVTMGTATNPGYSTVDATGEVNPNGEALEYFYEVSSDGGATWTPKGPRHFSAASTPQTVAVTVPNLMAETGYEIRLVADNLVDGSFIISTGPNPTFTTLGPVAKPTPTIDPVTTFTNRTAHFTGSIDPGAANSDPGFNVRWRFVCEPACESLSNEAGEFADDGDVHPVATDAVVLPNHSYTVELVAENAGGAETVQTSFQTAAPAPGVETIPAFSLAGGTTAIAGGIVNPENSETVFWVEYGPTTGYGTSVPVTRDALVGAGEEGVYVVRELTGLNPSTTYHVRVVAESAKGRREGNDLTFTTAPAESAESALGSLQLPDNRKWEMVSPVDKNNAGIWKASGVAAAEGGGLIYKSQGSFAGQPASRAGLVPYYIAKRGTDSWSSQGIAPAGGGYLPAIGYQAFAENLSTGVFTQIDELNSKTVPAAPVGGNIYRANLTGSGVAAFELLNGPISITESFAFGGASADTSHIAFASIAKLTPDSPCSSGFEFCAYEWADGVLRLASQLPGNVPSTGTVSNQYGSTEGVVSADGSHVYFNGPEGHLYAREGGVATTLVDAFERTTPAQVPEAPAQLINSGGPHGERVLFKTTEDLLDADENTTADLYLWDGSRPSGHRLTMISKGNVAGVAAEVPDAGSPIAFRHAPGGAMGANRALTRVYFLTTNQIEAGAPDAAGLKLYLWEAGAEGGGNVRYIAGGLDETRDGEAWTADILTVSEFYRTSRVSPDGRYLAFVAGSRITAYDNDGHNEVYLYDAATGQLTCASCTPDGESPKTDATLNAFKETEKNPIEGQVDFNLNSGQTPMYLPRNLTDSGRLFFESKEALVSRDSNGKGDVYEFVGGASHLISSGTGSAGSQFLDADLSGNDVFFTTSARLVGWDQDDSFDAYDARVDGGLPEPPAGVIGCEADACQPAPNPPNDPTPASESFRGPGNEQPVKAKKKHHKKHHHKKKHHNKKHHEKKKHGHANKKKG